MNQIKRMRCFLLSVVMFLCCGIRLSAQGSEVGGYGSYSVEETYTVIIPSQPITLITKNYSEINIKVGKGTNISVGHRLAVYVKETEQVRSNLFLLDRYDVSGSYKQTGVEADTVAVSMQIKENQKYRDIDPSVPIAIYSDIAKQDVQIGSIYLMPTDQAANAKAGLYRGTLTFSIQIENQ